MKKIRTYSAEGRRYRDYSLDALLKLARMRKVYFSFGRRGQLLCANFLPHDASKLLRTAHMGQHYCFPEKLGGAGNCWSFSPFLNPHNLPGVEARTAEDVDLFLRAIFRAVQLSCVRRDDETPPPSLKVVSIASARRPRPVDVIGERRAA
jgi:hypothetical protein